MRLRAAHHAYRAARQAASLHAHHEAVAHYELALSGGAGTREEILGALGDQHQALGELEEAIAHYCFLTHFLPLAVDFSPLQLQAV